MGIFQLFFGSDKSKRSISNNNFSKNRIEILQKTEELRVENKTWQTEFDHLIKLRKKAQKFEKENKLYTAIEIYSKSINIGESNKFMMFNNYTFDIERKIILLSKTKQSDSLKLFLNEKIEIYFKEEASEKWKKRLNKLEIN